MNPAGPVCFNSDLGSGVMRRLCLSAQELARIETPWEPYDELLGIFRCRLRSGAVPVVPWALARAALTATERAKNTCSPYLISEMVALMMSLEREIEARSGIEQLGDLARTALG